MMFTLFWKKKKKKKTYHRIEKFYIVICLILLNVFFLCLCSRNSFSGWMVLGHLDGTLHLYSLLVILFLE